MAEKTKYPRYDGWSAFWLMVSSTSSVFGMLYFTETDENAFAWICLGCLVYLCWGPYEVFKHHDD